MATTNATAEAKPETKKKRGGGGKRLTGNAKIAQQVDVATKALRGVAAAYLADNKLDRMQPIQELIKQVDALKSAA
jgi:hypothetical protein